MKKITEMTHEEIIGLSKKDLEDLTFYEMALEGIKLPVEPKEPEYPHIEAPSVPMWTCDAFSFHVDDFDVLNELVKFLIERKKHLFTIDTDWQSDMSYIQGQIPTSGWSNKINPSTSNFYTKDEYNDLHEKMKIKKELAKRYKEELDEYNAEKEAVDEVYSRINAEYLHHCHLEAKMARYKGILRRYLKVSSGDKEIAWKFFLEAYDTDFVELQDGLDKIKGQFFADDFESEESVSE